MVLESSQGKYVLKVDPNQDDKAKEMRLCNFSRPHMRAFHCSWWSFFVSFFMWFAISPLLGEIQGSLEITKQDIWTSSICSVAGTIIMRFIFGPLCDKYGARIPMGIILMMASLPTALTGLVKTATGLSVLRLFTGICGSSFVMCQSWNNSMFTKEVAGTANSLAIGWGTIGSGVSQIMMGSVLFPLFKLGMSSEKAWRSICVVPAIIGFATGVIIMCISDDLPKGNYKEMKKNGSASTISATRSLRTSCLNINTWLLSIQYACCLGVELTMNNAAALYFQDNFFLTTESAAAIASIVGWVALFACGLGGYVSDRMNRMMGMRGRLLWQTVCLLAEGVMVLIFANSDNLVVAIFVTVLLSILIHSSEGSTYGIVPYIDHRVTGSIAGVVGAGGSTGAVCFGLLFRQLESKQSLIIMGVVTLISAFLSCFILVKGHQGLIFGKDSPESKKSWKNETEVVVPKPQCITDRTERSSTFAGSHPEVTHTSKAFRAYQAEFPSAVDRATTH